MPHGILVNIAVNGFAQRLYVQPAAAHYIHKKVVQVLFFGGGGQLQHVVQLHAAPDVLCLLHLTHGKQNTVQRADAGTGDDIRHPAQLLQGVVDPHMVAALGTAARQHQCAHGRSLLVHGTTSYDIYRHYSIFMRDIPQDFSRYLPEK